MANAFGIVLESASMKWAAAEGVPRVAAILLLHERSVDDIVALKPGEIE
jgi:hypothetical protein